MRAPLWGAGEKHGEPSDTGAGKNTGERGCSGGAVGGGRRGGRGGVAAAALTTTAARCRHHHRRRRLGAAAAAAAARLAGCHELPPAAARSAACLCVGLGLLLVRHNLLGDVVGHHLVLLQLQYTGGTGGAGGAVQADQREAAGGLAAGLPAHTAQPAQPPQKTNINQHKRTTTAAAAPAPTCMVYCARPLDMPRRVDT